MHTCTQIQYYLRTYIMYECRSYSHVHMHLQTQVYLPMGYCYAQRLSAEVTPIITDLREVNHNSTMYYVLYQSETCPIQHCLFSRYYALACEDFYMTFLLNPHICDTIITYPPSPHPNEHPVTLRTAHHYHIPHPNEHPVTLWTAHTVWNCTVVNY